MWADFVTKTQQIQEYLLESPFRFFNVADRPPIDFSIGEDSLEQPAAAGKLPPGAPGLAKITLVVTEEGGERVRLTLHDITARLLGVDTPLLPSITERRKLALEYAEVRRAHLIGSSIALWCRPLLMLSVAWMCQCGVACSNEVKWLDSLCSNP